MQNYVILTGISEQPDFRKGILKMGIIKKTLGGFLSLVYTLPTHIYIQTTCKVNVVSDYPFNHPLLFPYLSVL